MDTTTDSPADQPTACAKCQGTGKRGQPQPGTKGWDDLVWVDCPACSGTGRVVQIH